MLCSGHEHYDAQWRDYISEAKLGMPWETHLHHLTAWCDIFDADLVACNLKESLEVLKLEKKKTQTFSCIYLRLICFFAFWAHTSKVYVKNCKAFKVETWLTKVSSFESRNNLYLRRPGLGPGCALRIPALEMQNEMGKSTQKQQWAAVEIKTVSTREIETVEVMEGEKELEESEANCCKIRHVLVKYILVLSAS